MTLAASLATTKGPAPKTPPGPSAVLLGPRLLNHDDGTPLRVLFSVLATSLTRATPESMGEEAVQSISVGMESVATTESCSASTGSTAVTAVAGSGATASLISVTGRMTAAGEGLKGAAAVGEAESTRGGGVDGGEVAPGVGGVRERGDSSLTRGGGESDGGRESWSGGVGGSLGGGGVLDSSSK